MNTQTLKYVSVLTSHFRDFYIFPDKPLTRLRCEGSWCRWSVRVVCSRCDQLQHIQTASPVIAWAIWIDSLVIFTEQVRFLLILYSSSPISHKLLRRLIYQKMHSVTHWLIMFWPVKGIQIRFKTGVTWQKYCRITSKSMYIATNVVLFPPVHLKRYIVLFPSEHLLASSDILKKSRILDRSQCGFRKHRSIIDHLVSFERHRRDAFAQRQQAVGLLSDLVKAYETTWQYGIIRKIGLRGRLPVFVSEYLRDHRIPVRIGTTLSDEFYPEEGVPTGGVLTVTCFGQKINELPSCIAGDVFRAVFVDDLSICSLDTREAFTTGSKCYTNMGTKEWF